MAVRYAMKKIIFIPDSGLCSGDGRSEVFGGRAAIRLGREAERLHRLDDVSIYPHPLPWRMPRRFSPASV